MSGNPCEKCIIKVNCSSKFDCPMRINYIKYKRQLEGDKLHLNQVKNQAAVDSYFKRFRRSR
jgi:hypothetical protein